MTVDAVVGSDEYRIYSSIRTYSTVSNKIYYYYYYTINILKYVKCK